MNGRPWRSLLVLSWLFGALGTIFLGSLASPFMSKARAESASVTVLGVRSLDGEDQLERRVSHALRNSARDVEGYRISDREVSLAQMSLAHGCEDVDIPCLKDIAATLSADRLIYGNLVRSGDKVRITLFNFDARGGQIDASAERTVVASTLANDAALTEVVVGLTQRLSGKRGTATGGLRITGNRPGASVSLDGRRVGELGPDGEFTLPQVAEGPHMVLVESTDGRDRRELAVEIRPDTTTTLRALLTQPLPPAAVAAAAPVEPPAEDKLAKKKYLKRVLGWTSVGVAAGFAAATIYSWVRIGSIGDNETLKRYAHYYPEKGENSTSDACKEAIDGHLTKTMTDPISGKPTTGMQVSDEAEAAKLCKEADKLETLQWVFIGGTVAFAGVGTWLLWSGYKKEPVTLSVRPSFGIQSGSLHATLHF